MATNNNLTDFVTDIADTIREKVGSSSAINPQSFGNIIAENPNLSLVYTHTDKIETDGGEFWVDLKTVPNIANRIPYTGSGKNAVNIIYVYVCVVELSASSLNAGLAYGVYQDGSTQINCKIGTFAESTTQRVTFGLIDNLCYDSSGDTITRDTLLPIAGWLGGFEAGQSCTVTTNVYLLSIGSEANGGSNPLAVSTCKGVPEP